MSKDSPLHEDYLRYHNSEQNQHNSSGGKRQWPQRDFPGPLIADGFIFVSRGEFLARTELATGSYYAYKSKKIIPRSSYRNFTCFQQPSQSRFFEEYVNLIEDNKIRLDQFESQKAFYSFIRKKWERYKNELVNQIPTEWD